MQIITVRDTRHRPHDDYCETGLDIPRRYADIFDRHSSGRDSVGHRWPGTRLRAGHDLEHGRGAGQKQRKRRKRAKNSVPSMNR